MDLRLVHQSTEQPDLVMPSTRQTFKQTRAKVQFANKHSNELYSAG